MKNTTSVYIARHGITPWNQEGRIQGQGNDIPLSKEGCEQMERLGKYLSKNINNPIVLLSPLLRSQESFTIVNKYINVKSSDIHIIPELIEMNFGKFEALLKKEIQSDIFFTKRKKDKYRTSYPEGESYEDIYKRLLTSRVKSIFEDAKNGDRDILFVGHESTNRIIPLVLGLSGVNEKTAVENRQKNNEIIIYSYPFQINKIQTF